MPRFQVKRGLKSSLPNSGMLVGEPHFTTNRGTLHVATSTTSTLPVVPAIDDLTVIPAIDGNADLLIIHDASETSGQKEKKITVESFKTSLNIPPGSTDEKVAIVAGGTAGFVWGTDGTNGIIRLSNSLSWTKDVGNSFVTIEVATVDGGTF